MRMVCCLTWCLRPVRANPSAHARAGPPSRHTWPRLGRVSAQPAVCRHRRLTWCVSLYFQSCPSCCPRWSAYLRNLSVSQGPLQSGGHALQCISLCALILWGFAAAGLAAGDRRLVCSDRLMRRFASLQSETIVKPLDQAAQMQQAERRRSGRASWASQASRTTAGHSL